MARIQKLSKRIRSQAVLLLVGILAVTLGVGISVAGSGNDLVRTLGDETFQANVKVQATLKFAPGNVKVSEGETLTIRHDDKTSAPHTVTIVDEAELPESFEDFIDLGAVCPTCVDALDEHFGGADVSPPPGPFDALLNSGAAGFNESGDSILFFDDQEVDIEITAESGTTLSYLCAIHPWMQGTIEVQ